MNIIQTLNKIVELYAHETPSDIQKLPESGSHRLYYRIFLSHETIIGVYNQDIKENEAFISYTNHFHKLHINVPQLLYVDSNLEYYLLEDLGQDTLFTILNQERQGEHFSEKLIQLYRQVIRELPRIQIQGGKNIDYSKAYPIAAFDEQSMYWDLNYFKYYFLKLSQITFNEHLLEQDFHTLVTYLMTAESDFFLYRDFQSRNIMIHNNEVFFIDYQGGRKGTLAYDIASLLYDGKADIPQTLRNEFLDLYIQEVQKYHKINVLLFKQQYWAFVLIRILQSMGAYGYRGFYEKKTHFLQSIPYALNNMAYILHEHKIKIQLPYLFEKLEELCQSSYLKELGKISDTLQITITSFSYKKGIPEDMTENGGGFVFDCRALPNPGREEKYCHLTGRDQAVKDYLLKYTEVYAFQTHVFAIIEQSVENYIHRNFSHLMISFGCTGGQHRSVFFADGLAAYLKKYPVRIQVIHTQLKEQYHIL